MKKDTIIKFRITSKDKENLSLVCSAFDITISKFFYSYMINTFKNIDKITKNAK